MSQSVLDHTPARSRIVFRVTRNLRSSEAFLDHIFIYETGGQELEAPSTDPSTTGGRQFSFAAAAGRLEVVSSGCSAEQIIYHLLMEGFQLTHECELALEARLSPAGTATPIPLTEHIHMRKSDLELLERRGLPVQGVAVIVEVAKEEQYNGFRTVCFYVGRDAVEVYLDIRNERGGPYQFTRQSKQTLKADDF